MENKKQNKKPSELYVIPETNGDGYKIQKHYKQVSQQKSTLSEAECVQAVVKSYYFPSIDPKNFNVIKDGSSWIITLKQFSDFTGQSFNIGCIELKNFEGDDSVPMVYFSNRTIREMALEKKSFVETSAEPVADNVEAEVCEFLKKFKRVTDRYSSGDAGSLEKLFAALKNDLKSEEVKNFDVNKELQDLVEQSHTICGLGGGGYLLGFLFASTGTALMIVSPLPLAVIFGVMLLAVGASLFSFEVVATIFVRTSTNAQLQEVRELIDSANSLSPAAVNLLMQTKDHVVVQGEEASDISETSPLPVYLGQNDDLSRIRPLDDWTNPFVEEQVQVVNPPSYNAPLTQPSVYGSDLKNPFVPLSDALGLEPVYTANPPKQ